MLASSHSDSPRSLGKGLSGMACPGLRVPCILEAPRPPIAPCASLWPGGPGRGLQSSVLPVSLRLSHPDLCP